jgi:hypothetical protein
VKRPFLHHPTQDLNTVSLTGLALFFLFFILACGGGGEETPPEGQPEAAAQQQGTLVCSEECAARGQCGTSVNDGSPVILGHPDQPAVQDHQMTFQAEYTLPIIDTKDELLQVLTTGEQFTHRFFLLQRADGRAGWVAGWCLNPQ